MENVNEKELEMTKVERGEGKDVINDFFTLKQQILNLGSINVYKDLKTPINCTIIAGVLALLAVISLYVSPLCVDRMLHQLLIYLGIMLLSVGALVYGIKESGAKKYEERRCYNAHRRNRIIEYMIRYYFVHDAFIEASKVKGIKDKGLNNVISNLGDDIIKNSNNKVEIEFLNDKFEREWNECDSKIKRSILLTFAVALATSGIAFIKELSSALYWNFVENNIESATNSGVSAIGNMIAFVSLCYIVLIAKGVKGLMDSSESSKRTNLEYACLVFRKLKSIM